MFKLIRFFFFTSVVVAVILTVAVIQYHRHEVQRTIDLAENQNIALARSFANTLWPYFSPFVMPTSDLNPASLQQLDVGDIESAIRAVSAGLPVLKIKIYNLNGLTVYSSDPTDIGEDKSTNPGYFSAAREGKPASKLTYKDTLSSFEGEVLDRDFVESYLPIRQGDGPVEGVFELYSDVTPILATIRRSGQNLIIGYVFAFGISFGFLYISVYRADTTIKKQYREIAEKNQALGAEIEERTKVEINLKKAREELELRVEERTKELVEEISERQIAEYNARRHRDNLAHYGRISIMGEMASSLAHELNQPLSVISGNAQLCLTTLQSGTNTEVLEASLNQVNEQANRATEIIRQARRFVQKKSSENQNIDTNQMILEIIGLIRPDAQEHETEIKLDLANDLPEVSADPIQIQQVVMNLAHNGMEVMRETAPKHRVLEISTSRSRDKVEVVIRDAGKGIPQKIQEQMFEPFFTTKENGLGMGLSICRSIIESHGGRLWAVTDSGTGSEFRFTLPAVKKGVQYAS
jgi:signal transduction histidine kinase